MNHGHNLKIKDSESAEISVVRDGAAVTLNWKAMGILVAATVAATSAWLSLKFEVSQIRTDVLAMKTQVEKIGDQLTRKNTGVVYSPQPKDSASNKN